jgi:transcriptional regulator with XRE-family HTH domain
MEDFTPQEIAKALRLLRYAKGWTGRQVERESGVAANSFTAYQAMRRRPSLATRRALADRDGLHLGELGPGAGAPARGRGASCARF